ncbi:MAG: pilus assembly FimT family protein [Terriglobia bacterium]
MLERLLDREGVQFCSKLLKKSPSLSFRGATGDEEFRKLFACRTVQREANRLRMTPLRNVFQQPAKARRQHSSAFRPEGFTLLGVLIALAVATALTSICLPIFQSASQSYRLSSAVMAVTGAIQSTRYAAIMHGYPYILVLNTANETYQVQNEPPGSSSFSNVGTAIPWSSDKSITLSPATTFQFSPGGTVTANSGALTFTLSNGISTETITVSEVGNVTVSP